MRILNKRVIIPLAVLAAIAVLGFLAIDFCVSIVNPVYSPVSARDIEWRRDASFIEQWNDPAKRFHTALDVNGSGHLYLGTFLPINDDSQKVLVVLVHQPQPLVNNPQPMPATTASQPAPTSLPPPMRIGLSSLLYGRNKYFGHGSVLPHGYGDPPIICDLNMVQAEYVWDNGVPASLVQEFLNVAAATNWQPLPPVSGAGPLRPIISVDPAPHFETHSQGEMPATDEQ